MLRRSLLAILIALPAIGVGLGSCASSKSGSSSSKGNEQDIPDMLAQLDQFKEFLRAAKTAGLMGTLSSPGPYTVFAPTDGAFGSMRQRDRQKIMGDKALLAQVLKYHVVAGRFLDRDLAKVDSLKTLEGHSLRIVRLGNRMAVDEAGLYLPNLRARNGVIHGIDVVLTPTRL